jgi:tetratricopeptide (TPR) repeat protein
VDLGQVTENGKATVDALLTMARARMALGETETAIEASGRAAQIARELGNPMLVRKALREWAEELAADGQHERAFEIMREALAAS